MIQIDFISAECYPAAKVGGLADVVGALPKFMNKEEGVTVNVVMPYYDLKFFNNHHFDLFEQSSIEIDGVQFNYNIYLYPSEHLGFSIMAIDIPDLFFRKGVYADESNQFFSDETLRYISFQRIYLNYILANADRKPDIIHCHDHHTGLIPFMIKYCEDYKELMDTPTVFTIHNERYQGSFSWDLAHLLPSFDERASGMLDWENQINPLASAIKCAWQVTTVSPEYMRQLQDTSSNIQWLFQNEAAKSQGILNGIDYEVWDPKEDNFLTVKLKRSATVFKSKNKENLLAKTKLDANAPLISFIGRFALEKGADILAYSLESLVQTMDEPVFLILGTGDSELEYLFANLAKRFEKRIHAELRYDEALAHRIYASSDFLIMPSRVEPCGLNQMYAMRYGTIPVVHSTGGLVDSVQDGINGIQFHSVDIGTLHNAINQCVELNLNKSLKTKMVEEAMNTNFSWEKSSNKYLKIYDELKKSTQ